MARQFTFQRGSSASSHLAGLADQWIGAHASLQRLLDHDHALDLIRANQRPHRLPISPSSGIADHGIA
jgi:hypothetical protein